VLNSKIVTYNNNIIVDTECLVNSSALSTRSLILTDFKNLVKFANFKEF